MEWYDLWVKWIYKSLVVNLYYKPFKTVLRKARCDQLQNNFKTFKGILRKPSLSLKMSLSWLKKEMSSGKIKIQGNKKATNCTDSPDRSMENMGAPRSSCLIFASLRTTGNSRWETPPDDGTDGSKPAVVWKPILVMSHRSTCSLQPAYQQPLSSLPARRARNCGNAHSNMGKLFLFLQ